MTPSISSDNIDGDVVDKGLDMSQNFQYWTRTFRLAQNIKSEDYITQEDNLAQKCSMKNARVHKIPRRDKIDDNLDLGPQK